MSDPSLKPEFSDLLPEDPTGIKVWRNRNNKFVIASLHYTADPSKRDPRWREEAKKGMPQGEWDREYELSWDTHAGQPVYGADFNESLHVYLDDVGPEPGLPILRGWDFGLTPACIIGQLEGRRLTILAEVVETSMGAARFVPQVIDFCGTRLAGFDFFDFVDPSGFSRSESEETSCVDIMRTYGIGAVAGELTYEKRLGAVIELLTTLDGGRPCLMVNPSCKVLIGGFKGGYQYPEPASARSVIRMDRPLKNEFSHPHDALQYLASKIKVVGKMARPSRSRRIARPDYTFVERGE